MRWCRLISWFRLKGLHRIVIFTHIELNRMSLPKCYSEGKGWKRSFVFRCCPHQPIVISSNHLFYLIDYCVGNPGIYRFPLKRSISYKLSSPFNNSYKFIFKCFGLWTYFYTLIMYVPSLLLVVTVLYCTLYLVIIIHVP